MNHPIMVTIADMAALITLRVHAPLSRELDRAIVVSSMAMPPDVATMNSKVRYVDETAGERKTVSLVYPEQADAAAGRVSVLSPVGTALLGLSAGQAIDWDFPDGSRRRLRLETVLDQPERRRNTPLPRAP
jgi:regulator of nucleoside diphosphate kinase